MKTLTDIFTDANGWNISASDSFASYIMKPNNNKNKKRNKGTTNLNKVLFIFTILLLLNYYVPLRLGLYYLDLSLFAVLAVICIVVGVILRFCYRTKLSHLASILYCSMSSLYLLFVTANFIYLEKAPTVRFETKVLNAYSHRYRTPAELYFKLNGFDIHLGVRNEYPVLLDLNKGKNVVIYGEYKIGLLSTIQFISWDINND